MRTLGLDPGARGALALLIDGKVADVADMPAIEIRGKARVDAAEIKISNVTTASRANAAR